MINVRKADGLRRFVVVAVVVVAVVVVAAVVDDGIYHICGGRGFLIATLVYNR